MIPLGVPMLLRGLRVEGAGRPRWVLPRAPHLSASKVGKRASSSMRSPVTKRLAAGASCGSTALVMAARRQRMATDISWLHRRR